MTRGMDPSNLEMADRFDEMASLLERQGADRFRIGAYRRGAQTLRTLDEPASTILERDGLGGLVALPAIGESLARSIRTLIRTGRLPQLARLRGEVDPEALLRTVPGIGTVLAKRLHDELHIDDLEDLELAAHDGRLARMDGFGPKRLETIRAALAQRLGRIRIAPERRELPDVLDLLDIDREYRDRAGRGDLPTIAPRRMNPKGEAWLPILHTERHGKPYTALFSNTPRAHELGRTRDWVVIYPEYGASPRPYTIVTERRGPLAGRRVVRGREDETPAA